MRLPSPPHLCSAWLLFVCGLLGHACAEQDSVVLREIIDHDSQNEVVLRRAEFRFDLKGQRVFNVVFDGDNEKISTESFRYDAGGKLVGRRHMVTDGTVKWAWKNVKHDASGSPLRCDIVNKKGKKIGWNVWHYDDRLRMVKRERFNANGTLRFYYADIQYDDAGNFAKWVKYDGEKNVIGTKVWTYAKPRE